MIISLSGRTAYLVNSWATNNVGSELEKDLVVCVRCHKYPSLIVDTVQSIKWATDPDRTAVMLAVDGRPKLADRMKKLLPSVPVYCSGKKWGWGPGLYGLLVESILWAGDEWHFSHFMSVDYDTLMIGEEADRAVLGAMNIPMLGLLGSHCVDNAHWRKVFNKEKDYFEKSFGSVPDTYTPGEGVQGGCLVLTEALIRALSGRGMFSNLFKNVRKYTSIADDHLLPIFTRMCGLGIRNIKSIARCEWKASRDPRGLENEGVVLFHPTKIKPGNKSMTTEVQVRNYFRAIRGQGPLPEDLKE